MFPTASTPVPAPISITTISSTTTTSTYPITYNPFGQPLPQPQQLLVLFPGFSLEKILQDLQAFLMAISILNTQNRAQPAFAFIGQQQNNNHNYQGLTSSQANALGLDFKATEIYVNPDEACEMSFENDYNNKRSYTDDDDNLHEDYDTDGDGVSDVHVKHQDNGLEHTREIDYDGDGIAEQIIHERRAVI